MQCAPNGGPAVRPPGRDQTEGEELNRRLKLALIIIDGAVLAVVAPLAIEMFLVDWGNW